MASTGRVVIRNGDRGSVHKLGTTSVDRSGHIAQESGSRARSGDPGLWTCAQTCGKQTPGAREAPRSKRPRGLPLTVVPPSPTGRGPATALTVRLRPGTRWRPLGDTSAGGTATIRPSGSHGATASSAAARRVAPPRWSVVLPRVRPRRLRAAGPRRAGSPAVDGGSAAVVGEVLVLPPREPQGVEVPELPSTAPCTCCPQAPPCDRAEITGLCTTSVDDAPRPARLSAGSAPGP
jgi:hypothetical protein